MKTRGFSLSEVLTTLMIVGVIAAMTLPILVQGIEQQKKLSMLKKLYSSYNVNINTVLAEHNCDSFSCLRKWGNEDVNSNPTKHNGVLGDTRYFNINFVCENCFSDVKLPSGAIAANSTAYMLKNGANSLVYDFAGNCTQTLPTVTANGEKIDLCSIIVIDVNGNKLPNKPANDIFAFYLSDIAYNGSHLIPIGMRADYPNNNDNVVSTILNPEEQGYNSIGLIISNNWKWSEPKKIDSSEIKDENGNIIEKLSYDTDGSYIYHNGSDVAYYDKNNTLKYYQKTDADGNIACFDKNDEPVSCK